MFGFFSGNGKNISTITVLFFFREVYGV
uniref:At4g25875 n=1 Tax=Arabidopsis thaliana TaxID=3702 RepID=Q94F22_ARATH|nr:Unknown protein [Arabidopsis thaliana]AAP21313.1 At4g25875 [Arabidopsis thaliana]